MSPSTPLLASAMDGAAGFQKTFRRSDDAGLISRRERRLQ
jgi:hypothetical protein